MKKGGSEFQPNALIGRRGLLKTFAASLVVAAPVATGAFGILRSSGDIRRLRMFSGRTGEKIDIIYWIDGKYVKEALNEIDYFMRDWRSNSIKGIDPVALDVIAASQLILNSSEPFQLMSGYRTEKTNAMLRRRSRGVARNSFHVKAKAADLRLRSRSVRQVSNAAKSLSAGGVGRYNGSNFVHIDSGPIRNWTG